MEKCKTCKKINECDFDLTKEKECNKYEEAKDGKENE